MWTQILPCLGLEVFLGVTLGFMLEIAFLERLRRPFGFALCVCLVLVVVVITFMVLSDSRLTFAINESGHEHFPRLFEGNRVNPAQAVFLVCTGIGVFLGLWIIGSKLREPS